MMKNFINKILNVPKLIRRIWLLLWILLAILLVMKFCFGIWYPVVSNNEVFNNVCDFINNNEWCKLAIALNLYILSFNISFMTFIGIKYYKKWYTYILMIGICIIIFFLKNYNNGLGLILEIIALIIVSIIINIKENTFKKNITNILLPIVIYILVNLFQLTIFGVRGLKIEELTKYPVLIPYILQIDYYIFTIITWIGVSFMGIYGIGWLWTNDITSLKAIREKELKKENPNMKKISSLDSKIAELEKEGK